MRALDLKLGDRFYADGRLFQYTGLQFSKWHNQGWDIRCTCLQDGKNYILGDLYEVTLFEESYCDGLGI